MKSSWAEEILAIAKKEFQAELRNPSSSFTAIMLTVSTVFTLAFAFSGRKLDGEGAAGMLWASLLFAGVGTLARAFIAEEEQGTGDLLRLWARPHSVFWGKVLFATVQMLVTSVMVCVLFMMLAGLSADQPVLLAFGLIAGSLSLAATVTVVSAIIAQGSNRNTLGGVVALPLLLPLIAMGVLAGRTGIAGTAIFQGQMAIIGIFCYAVLVLAIAPHLFASIWREN